MKDIGWGAAILLLVGVSLAAAAWLMLPGWYPQVGPLSSSDRTQDIPGVAFSAARGRGVSSDGSARLVEELHVNQALFVRRSMIQTSEYSALRLKLSGVHPDLQTEFFWVTMQNPRQPRYLPLKRGQEDVSWHLLAGQEGWEGMTREIGIFVTGAYLDEPIRLEEVSLQPVTRAVLARLTWQDWRVFAPWRQGSANRYIGFTDTAAFSPVSAVAVWLLGSLLVLLAVAVLRRWPLTRALPPAIFVAVVPWLALDGLWQHRLDQQVDATQERFGGLDQAEKRNREDDADLRQQARQVLESLAPVRGRRVFLLREADDSYDFHRLRLQYHLLPLNVYNYGKQLPDPSNARPGDFVLLQDNPESVTFDASRGVLHDDEVAYPARLVESLRRMTLYRLEDAGEPR